MSISATMFVKLVNPNALGLSKRFFPVFASIVKLQSEKVSFFDLNDSQKFSQMPAQQHSILILESLQFRLQTKISILLNQYKNLVSL